MRKDVEPDLIMENALSRLIDFCKLNDRLADENTAHTTASNRKDVGQVSRDQRTCRRFLQDFSCIG